MILQCRTARAVVSGPPDVPEGGEAIAAGAGPGAAAGTIALARGFGSTLGTAVFGALICALIGGTQDLSALRDASLPIRCRCPRQRR